MQVYHFFKENNEIITKLTREGYMSLKHLSFFDIYEQYLRTPGKYKNDRYEEVAVKNNCSLSTVRRAIGEMKRHIR